MVAVGSRLHKAVPVGLIIVLVSVVLEPSEAKFHVWLAPALPCWLAVGKRIHGERVVDNRVAGRCDRSVVPAQTSAQHTKTIKP